MIFASASNSAAQRSGGTISSSGEVLARIVENPVSRRPAFPRPWPASWLVLGAFILGAGSGFGATDPVLKPLPKNRAFDGYASRAEFLQHTAAFESERLRRAGFRTEAEPAHWAR